MHTYVCEVYVFLFIIYVSFSYSVFPPAHVCSSDTFKAGGG